MSRVVCLTGMHRSGTSLTASWLQRCGLVIDVGGLIGSAAGNLLGHFEDEQIVNLHSEEIRAQQRLSRGWKITSAQRMTFAPPREHRARTLVESRNARFHQWGWKDPRSVPFLDEWLGIEPNLVTIILWRPAGQVVRSLRRRSQQSRNRDMHVRASTAWRVWNAYSSLALDFKARHPDRTLLVPTSSVISDSKTVFELARSQLHMRLDYVPIEAMYQPSLLQQAHAAQHDGRRKTTTGDIEEALRRASDI